VAAVPPLRDALRDKNVVVRREAARALERIGRDAKPAVPELIEAIGDPDDTLRIAAYRVRSLKPHSVGGG
jgi:HEAT repeat protein